LRRLKPLQKKKRPLKPQLLNQKLKAQSKKD
jgi:hypothetical protein